MKSMGYNYTLHHTMSIDVILIKIARTSFLKKKNLLLGKKLYRNLKK